MEESGAKFWIPGASSCEFVGAGFMCSQGCPFNERMCSCQFVWFHERWIFISTYGYLSSFFSIVIRTFDKDDM